MPKLTNYVVDRIRSMYSSGLYHKADLFVNFSSFLKTPDTLNAVLNYSIYPEVREDLRIAIMGMPFVFEAVSAYHLSLQQAVVEETYKVNKNSTKTLTIYAEAKEKAIKELKTKLLFINSQFNTNFSLYDLQSRLNCL